MNTLFNDLIIRDWLFNAKSLKWNNAHLLIHGSGPFDFSDFKDFLTRCPFQVSEVNPYSGFLCGTLIVGQYDWDAELLHSLIEIRSGQTLKVYSQEMFLSLLFTGEDPFDAPRNVLERFAEGHSALEYLADLGFDWPTTLVFGGGETEVEADWPKIGPLKKMGYKVGAYGIQDAKKRHKILEKAFTGRLPNVYSPAYMQDWGAPNSKQRLKKIADSIASFCSLQKRKKYPPRLAIDHWEADLAWLYKKFYRGPF
jgi:hypothetical protein